MKRATLAALLCLLAATFSFACDGDDGDNGDATGTATRSTRTGTPGTRTGTPDATGTGTPGVPGAAGTVESQGTLSPEEAATVQARVDDITGASGTPPSVISTIPPPPPGVTPRVDPTEVAPPQPPSNDLQVLLDMDASTPGIQATRDVRVGDVFRVGLVLVNSPQSVGSVNFYVNYDKTKIVAPSIIGGNAIDRNPDLNQAALGGDAAGWLCLPEPLGDVEDLPEGPEGDGNPSTGQAFLSCFVTPPGGPQASGTLVVATIEFHAVASGTSQLTISQLALAVGETFTELGTCNPVIDVAISCVGASVTVN